MELAGCLRCNEGPKLNIPIKGRDAVPRKLESSSEWTWI